MKLVSASDAMIDDAAGLLQGGQLVAFPTETVYGLGGDARDDKAVAKIFSAKGRPTFNPLIVHVCDLKQAESLGEFSSAAHDLAANFWPGPLTLVVQQRMGNGISKLATAGLDTIALRIPAHPTARRLLESAGIPIAAPSANKSGRLSPTSPAHVAAEFGDEVAMILAGGRSEIGLESTVIDVSDAVPIILRPGGITIEEIEAIVGVLGDVQNDNFRSPGMLEKHYAPAQKLRMNATILNEGEAYLGFGPNSFIGRNAVAEMNLSEAGDLTEAAANLFAMLHELDRPGYDGIAVGPIPDIALGVAINDRLRRASLR